MLQSDAKRRTSARNRDGQRDGMRLQNALAQLLKRSNVCRHGRRRLFARSAATADRLGIVDFHFIVLIVIVFLEGFEQKLRV